MFLAMLTRWKSSLWLACVLPAHQFTVEVYSKSMSFHRFNLYYGLLLIDADI